MSIPASVWRSLPLIITLIGSAAVAAEIRVMAPSASGSGWDQLAQAMKTTLAVRGDATSIQVVNVPGGGGTIGLGQFLADPVDKQLLVTGLGMVTSTVIKNAPITLDRMTPVARLCAEHYLVVVPAGSPIRNFGELRAAFQSNPAKVSWAGGPAGGIDHVAAALFARAVGVDAQVLNYVPFLSTPDAATAVIERKVTAGFLPRVELIAALKAETVRVLAIASADRVERIAAPTLRENGTDLEFYNWRGVVAKPGIAPADRIALTELVTDLVSSGSWKEIIESRGWEPAFLPSQEFKAFIRAENDRVRGALKATGTLKSATE
ncbi:MAG TPA: tripartite tricarboxylate transporter substrate binding protein [Enterovirga sp.]